jgi:hypothetical protein
MSLPTRKNRRLIAIWTMVLISMVVLRTLFLPDLPPQASGLLMVIVPSLITIIAVFISGETYSDHSARKHKEDA